MKVEKQHTDPNTADKIPLNQCDDEQLSRCQEGLTFFQ